MNTPANRYPLLELALCAVLLLSAWPADGTSQEADTVSPVFVSASTDGGYITITFSEEVFASPLVRYVKEWSGAPLHLFLKAAFDVSINGRVIFLHDDISLSGTDLTLQMAYYAGPGDEVRVAYNNIFAQNAGGLLVDAAGNAVPYFSSQTVQNNAGSPGSNLVDGAVLTPGEITIPEGSSGTYTVKLASQPSENVTVKVMPYAIVQVTPAQLTFTPDNYDAPQTVTISTYDDNDAIDAWAAVLHQIVGANKANWTFIKVVVDDQDPPLVVSGNTSINYAEDGTSAVATYSVPNAGGTTVTWTLLGDDKRDFSISSAGVLTFKTPPDYENPADSNGDNVYRVTIHASNGTSTGALLDVAINITKPKPNTPATGTPTISGTTQVGQTLTASVSNIADEDGLNNASFSYQWIANDGTSDANISGATDAAYTLVEADAGKTIKVRVSFTDDAGNQETLTSAATATISELPVVSIVAVASPVSEGEPAKFRMSRTGPTTKALTVQTNWALSDRSTIRKFPVLFQAGKRNKTPILRKYDDQVVRDDLTVTITLVDGEGYRVSAAAAAAEVVMEDNDVAEFALSVDPAEVAEGESTTVRVEISNGVTFAEDQVIALDFAGSAATKGTDFTVSPESLTLRARKSSVSATVTALVDTDEEGDETIAVAATHGGATIGTEAVTISDADAVPLTASFKNMPTTHDGSRFTFELHFSEEIVISYVNVRDDVLEVSGGTVKRARRLNRPSNMSWEITVKPSSNANISIALSPTTDCETDSAVCTKGGNALSNSLSATVTGAASKPVAFGLDANYPNPFNSETQIAYTLPEAGLVELAIYNVGGQRIRTLVQGVQEMGRYQTVWDGRSDNGAALASGVYLSRLSSPQGMQVRRMLLLR